MLRNGIGRGEALGRVAVEAAAAAAAAWDRKWIKMTNWTEARLTLEATQQLISSSNLFDLTKSPAASASPASCPLEHVSELTSR